MKLRIYILIILSLGLCSCTADLNDLQVPGKDCIALTLYNTSMSTKANGDVTLDSGTARERLLTRLDIFLYPEGSQTCAFYKHVSGLNNASGSEKVPVYVSEETASALFPGDATECDVYVVANMPDNVNFTGHESVADIKDIAIRSEEFKEVVASDGSFVMPEKFIMEGSCKAIKSGESITGSVPLKRASSKITMTILVPEFLKVKATDASANEDKEEIWRPYFIDPAKPESGINSMHIGLHKGLLKTMVGDDNVIDNTDVTENADRFETLYTSNFSFLDKTEKEFDEGGVKVNKSYYRYTCDVSFYTYALDWVGQANDVQAPYFTLMIPWKRDGDTRFTTYYYQVVVNGKTKKVERNYWYDIYLNIGVLGSRIYNEPVELQDMSCYVLDWSDGDAGLKEDVNLNEWRYLVVPETYIEMNNTNKGYLPFESSHNVAWTLEWPGSLSGLDDIEKYNSNNRYSAYHINCSGKTPVSVQLSGVNNSSFTVSPTGDEIVLTNAIPANVYSPIYYHLKVWLDLTPNGVLDADEQSFVERVVFVQYPPIYIIPSQSASQSVFVNKYNKHSQNITYNNGKYVLAQCPGTSDSGDHMYVINVSSFNADDKFTYLDNEEYAYIIGDPRVIESDTDLNDDGWDMSGSWQADASGRKLTYYYPAASNRNGGESRIFQVISPKFRVASFLGGYSNGCTPEGAAMRCASYQEAGYPAGRWRLPTTAEINFVISLQQKGAIQNIFYGGNYYYSSTDQVQNQSTINIRAIDWNSSSFTGSVRCVYDEWYWGSEPEARKNAGFAGGYEFTWGDAPR